MATMEMTTENFETLLTKEGILFIDWWAEWCGPCQAFAPIYEEASGRHEDVTFAKIDTEAQQGLAAAFKIKSIPTLMVFRDGIPLYAQPGVVPGEALDDLVTQARALDMEKVRKEFEEARAQMSSGTEDES